MLSMIFSMAAPPPADLREAFVTTLHLGLGAGLYVVYATLANLALNARYRVVLIADTLLALAALMRTQSRQFAPLDEARDLREVPPPVLGQLLGEHAALADQLQAARDIVLESPRTPRRQRLAGMLVGGDRGCATTCWQPNSTSMRCGRTATTRRHWPRFTGCCANWRARWSTLADAMLLGRRPAAIEDRRPRLAALPIPARPPRPLPTRARRRRCWRVAWPIAWGTSTTKCCAW